MDRSKDKSGKVKRGQHGFLRAVSGSGFPRSVPVIYGLQGYGCIYNTT